jgi:hypothetical protein
MFKVECNDRDSWSLKELGVLYTDFDVLKKVLCDKRTELISETNGFLDF